MACIIALLVAACGGGSGEADVTTTGDGGATDTTQQPEATTTTSEADDDGGGQVVGIGDIPQECLDAFSDFLQEIEPIVEPIDWANATAADLEALAESLDPLSDTYTDEITGANCDDIELDASDEESFDFMIDFARHEAPGTVAYMEWIKEFATSVGGGSDGSSGASGDCETDVAAFQAIVAQGGTMMDLPLADLTEITNLMTSIGTNCSPERTSEVLSQPDVAAFMGSDG
jgi:hypothetical protein